jgi:diguanylate cyclase (GGDEF)-like protein
MELRCSLVLAETLAALHDDHALAVLREASALVPGADDNTAVSFYRVSAATRRAFGDTGGAYEDLLRSYQQAVRISEAAAQQSLKTQLTRFQAERQEAENRLLKQERLLQQARLDQASAESRALTLMLVAALGVAVTVGWLLYAQVLQRRRLHQIASRDDLTGMPNRRSIGAFARERLLAQRNAHEPLCIALADIDHFKRVNDSHGHPVGDEVLKAFARTCASLLRQGDQLGRWGGEEWLFVMPNLPAPAVQRVFERLRAAVAAAEVPGLPRDAQVSFSMGALVIEAGDAADLEATLQRVDSLLYRAKSAGRDCAVVEEAGPPPAAQDDERAPEPSSAFAD